MKIYSATEVPRLESPGMFWSNISIPRYHTLVQYRYPRRITLKYCTPETKRFILWYFTTLILYARDVCPLTRMDIVLLKRHDYPFVSLIPEHMNIHLNNETTYA